MRTHIESVCDTLGIYEGSQYTIESCTKKKYKLWFGLKEKNYIYGPDWKVIDQEGVAFHGSLEQCIDFYLRNETINEDTSI